MPTFIDPTTDLAAATQDLLDALEAQLGVPCWQFGGVGDQGDYIAFCRGRPGDSVECMELTVEPLGDTGSYAVVDHKDVTDGRGAVLATGETPAEAMRAMLRDAC